MGAGQQQWLGFEEVSKQIQYACMYLNKMSSVLTNLSVIQKLAKDLVQAKHLNYSQECIPYYVDESKFTIQHIEDLRNPSGHSLKSSLIRHRIPQTPKQQKPQPQHPPTPPTQSPPLHPLPSLSPTNSKCVVFLHGLGSSRLQALPLVDSLPEEYCLFAFDFAGSGKSQGEDITYGLRESEDICCILDYLRVNKGIREFVIWGRSMGAVASLLYSINLAEDSKVSITAKSQLQRIKGLVLDSPFSDFREVTKQIGLKRVKIPEFLLDFALNIIQNSFKQLLKDPKRNNKTYNPFQIKLGHENIDTKIPTIFLYSLIDQVVPKEHSQKIIKSYRSLFDKFVMEECSHNQSRPKQIIGKIFQSLRRFQVRVRAGVGLRDARDGDEERYGLTRNSSVDMGGKGVRASRRGISVQSKDKEREKSFVAYQQNYTEEAQTSDSKIAVQAHSYSSLKIEPRRQKVSCKMSKNAYITDSPTSPTPTNNNSPLKIRLSNSFNKIPIPSKTPTPKPHNMTTSIPSHSRTSMPTHTHTHAHTHTNINFYNTIEYDNSILHKKLKQGNGDDYTFKAQENRNNFKYRRSSQLTRKVEYQLNHTRYL